MRLVDADELLKYASDHETISTHLIWNAPTVDPVRHGTWKPLYSELNLYVCSECGGISVGETNYCHHCGSRNREEEK